ncbi:MAG TPA: hypothetical protein VF665_07315 [Longimicrobium sp.]|jgi:uncharacterized lipoprotein YajG|uniref:hypothetical protein n=1 Tax=Longimicrobium sp. TaxID=2029185 RepID=UPI002EDB7182
MPHLKGAARITTLSAAVLLGACERTPPVAVAPAPVALESFAARTGVLVETLNALTRSNEQLAQRLAEQRVEPANSKPDFMAQPDKAIGLLRTADDLRARYQAAPNATPPRR